MPRSETRAAFYAARPGGWRDWWNVLHPPYTAWHLSYVAFGAALAPRLDGVRLGATVAAFLAAVGVGAHALDELHGRPLGTRIPDGALRAAVVAGLAVALVLGVIGAVRVGWVLIPFMVAGPVLVVAYNAELLGGVVHTDLGFALAWGAFPVLVGYTAQAGSLGWPALVGAGAATAVSSAQRSLSTPVRLLRRRALQVQGTVELSDGRRLPLDRAALLLPAERALRALSWGMVASAGALVLARLVG